jgi:hypothetical protein
VRAGRAGGTLCVPYECWTGIQHETSANAAGERLAASRPGTFSVATYKVAQQPVAADGGARRR